MSEPFRHRVRVRFNECDPQGVVFYANYLMYVDVAMTEFWREAIGGSQAGDADLARAIELVHSSRAIDDTIERARHYGRRAVDALAAFPSGKAKSALVEAVEFAVARAY